MTNRTYRLLGFLPILILALFALNVLPAHAAEDDPGWNCSTQGNGICGPVTINPLTMTLHAANGNFPFTDLITLPAYAGGYCAYGASPLDGVMRTLGCAATLTPALTPITPTMPSAPPTIAPTPPPAPPTPPTTRPPSTHRLSFPLTLHLRAYVHFGGHRVF